ncbi:MAG TPA: VIT domain-containing protein [Longimicrobiales bacterium]|nr:VIT domain-containing protein [Longimicrobiales bacterium]
MRSFVIAAVALALAGPVRAQGWIDPVRPTPQWGVVKVRTAVNVQVTGRVARVEVEEWFQNRGPAMGESDYLYPLPGEAVFSNFSLFQGDVELRGETMDAQRARSIYEAIVRAKKDPALIELAGHGLVRARVFPIAQGETRKITLRYTQLMARAGDALQFRYSAGARHAVMVTPRPMIRGPDVVQGERTGRQPDRAPLSFTLTAEDGSAFRDAFSPTHDVNTTRDGGRLVVRPRSELDGDFALFLPLARAAVGITVATHKPSSEPGYFMLTLSPGDVRAAAVPRDITAVIDVSGSMSGEKIQQARNALRQVLNSLSARDRFRLIAFSNEVRSYRPEWTRASDAELDAARRWIAGLSAEGGTNISGALTEAFRGDTPDNRLGIILFLTDGLPSVGEQNPERIAQRAEAERGQDRVFAFGVGYDVNTYLLDRLSAAARGSTQYVQPGENVEQTVAALAAKIRHPVLADLRLGDSPVTFTEIYPRQLPDLFAGEELILFGRYNVERNTSVPVTVLGRRAGRAERYSTTATFNAHDNANDFIPRLWASRKIGFLAQQIKLHGQNPELVEEIRTVALRYGLLSEYTSYLVQEPAMVAQNRSAAAGRVLAPAPVSPTAAVGQKSVVAAEAARRERDVRSAAQLEQLQRDKTAALDQSGAVSRIVAGRHFTQDGRTWKEARQVDQRVVVLEPFSAAYFAVLRRLPELEPYWQELGEVLVAGKRVSVQVSSGGVSRLTDAELARLVADFRGHK